MARIHPRGHDERSPPNVNNPSPAEYTDWQQVARYAERLIASVL